MASSVLAEVARGRGGGGGWENSTTSSVNILVDVTVSTDEEYLVHIGEEDDAIAMLIDPAWLAA
jgi:hypothetical protein